MDTFKLFDVIALTEDIAKHGLRRGQVGTIVEVFGNGEAFEVDFSDRTGRTYELIAIDPNQMMRLQYEPDAIAA